MILEILKIKNDYLWQFYEFYELQGDEVANEIIYPSLT